MGSSYSSSISEKAQSNYNTFTAVFLPVFLTLMGVVIFLRMGWLVAIAGPLKIIVIISIATLISLITSISISSTATNNPIGSGGIYYVLSRTFGIELGFSISFPLFLAQSLGVAFYILGFTEVLLNLFPFLHFSTIALLTLLCVTCIAAISPKAVIKTQLLIFILLIVTFVCFFFGYSLPSDPYSEAASMSIPNISFWMLFSIFFPAVTGVENGLTLSDKLKNPHRSIPLGFITAVGAAYLLYIGAALIFYHRAPGYLLIEHSMIIQNMSRFKPLVILGILASCLSGALSAMLTAPKSLEALSQDKIFPSFIAKTYGSQETPIWALSITFTIALLGTLVGDLNVIAPILSMFFLISYATLNAATGLEAMIANPSWRPRLKAPWTLSLFGALLCMVVMLMISSGATILAFVSVILLYMMIKKKHLSAHWDDIRHSLFLFFSRYAIYQLSHLKPSAKTWRPNLLVFVGDPLLRSHLIQLTGSLTHKKGFLTYASILDHDKRVISYESIEEKKLSLYLEKSQTPALIKTYVAESLLSGMKNLIEHFGMGPLTPNTVVLGATEKNEKALIFSEIIKVCHKEKKNIIIIKEHGLRKRAATSSHKVIDVWWGGGFKNNSDLMLVLGYMLQTSFEWRGSILTLKTVVSKEEDLSPTQEKIESFLALGRLHLQTKIELQSKCEDLFKDTIKNSSKNADLVFLGLRSPFSDESVEDYAEYYTLLMKKTEEFPTIAFVLAAESMDFHKILT